MNAPQEPTFDATVAPAQEPVARVAPPVVAPQRTQGGGSSLLDLLLAVALSVAATLAVLYFVAPRYMQTFMPQQQQLATADITGLRSRAAANVMRRVREGVIPEQNVAAQVQDFNAALSAALARYSDSGIVVLDTGAVAAVPADVPDVTDALLKAITSGTSVAAEKQGGAQ